MKVLFLTSTLPRYEGDQQANFVMEQAIAWRNARPADELHILAPHDATAATNETHEGVSVHRFKYMWPERCQTLAYPAILPNIRECKWRALQLPSFLVAEFLAAKKLIRKHQIDLVYAHWIMPQGLVARFLKKTTGVPYILQNHSSDLFVFSKLGHLGHSMAQSVLRNSCALFCVNERQRQYALEMLPNLQCHVLPMGLNLDVDDGELCTSANDSKYAIGTISRLSQKKGLNYLIETVEALANEGITLPAAIAGDGEEAEALMRMQENAAISFPGFLSGAEKQAFFKDCFAMVFPSVSTKGDVEGLPVALLEALAAGKPVIASVDTNIALLQEWPQIQDSLLLLQDPTDIREFSDAIKSILALDTDQVTANAEILKKSIKRYNWEHLIEEYLEIIEGLQHPLTSEGH